MFYIESFSVTNCSIRTCPGVFPHKRETENTFLQRTSSKCNFYLTFQPPEVASEHLAKLSFGTNLLLVRRYLNLTDGFRWNQLSKKSCSECEITTETLKKQQNTFVLLWNNVRHVRNSPLVMKNDQDEVIHNSDIIHTTINQNLWICKMYKNPPP